MKKGKYDSLQPAVKVYKLDEDGNIDVQICLEKVPGYPDITNPQTEEQILSDGTTEESKFYAYYTNMFRTNTADVDTGAIYTDPLKYINFVPVSKTPIERKVESVAEENTRNTESIVANASSINDLTLAVADIIAGEGDQ